MSEPSSPDATPERRAVGGELVIPLLGFFFALYYFWSVKDAPWTAKVSSYFMGTVLIVLVVLFVARTALALARGEVSLGLGRLVEPGWLLPRRLGFLALAIGYVYALDYAGFTLTTFVFIAVAVLLLGGAGLVRRALVLATVFSVGGYLLFVVAFETRFPAGPLERAVGALLG